MKETYYFSHDYNASQDPKMMSLLSQCGLSGIGMYWIVVEILHQQPNSKILYKTYEDYIDFYGRIDGENEHLLNKIKQVLTSVELLKIDGDYIYSERVLNNKKERERLSQIRSEAGKKSAKVRSSLTSVQQNSTIAQQSSTIKGKERKGNKKKLNNITIESSRFAPPSLEDVKKYILDNNYNVDAENFINFYASKGWLVGKAKMKDWQAAVRTWNKRQAPKTNKFSNLVKL